VRHDAGAHDTSGSPFGDISGSAGLVVNDLSTIDVMMDIYLTDQDVLDMKAFLNSL